jgi:hypothetical protein
MKTLTACSVKNISGTEFADSCLGYIPDNLLYIEKLAKAKGLI